MAFRTIIVVVLSLCLWACPESSGKDTGRKDASTEAPSSLSETDEQDWLVLFDGSDLDEWKGYNTDEVSDSWSIRDKAMVFTPGGPGSHNIVTRRTFENFILILEWKVAKGANSGIFWGVHEHEDYSQPYLTGPEIQILDNENNAEGEAASGTHAAGSLFDMIACDPELVMPYGSWNKTLIEIDHTVNMARVEMNGTEAMTFPLSGPEWDELVANSKFKNWPGFGKYKTGHIGLQDHGDEVWFRNIKIKEIK